jgi:hypothetical protein
MTSKLAAICAIAFLLPALPSFAQQDQEQSSDWNAPNSQYGSPADGEQQEQTPEMFQKMKSAALDKHQKRIKILQDGVSCIQAATAQEQMRTCRDQERQAEEQLNPQMGRRHRHDRQEQGGSDGQGDYGGWRNNGGD